MDKTLCFSGADNDNSDANPDYIFFTITKFYVSVVKLSTKENQKLVTLLSKGF